MSFIAQYTGPVRVPPGRLRANSRILFSRRLVTTGGMDGQKDTKGKMGKMVLKGVWVNIRLKGISGRLSQAMSGQLDGSSVSSMSYISSPTNECTANAP